MADLAEWKRRASNGTSGDMVRDILSDWQSATDTAEALKPSYNSVRDAIAPDCLQCRVHGRCSVSKGSDYCKHLFWCNRHP